MMLKDFMEKLENINEQRCSFSEEIETIEKRQMKVL